MLFALEGPDGCGKTTLFRLLSKQLPSHFKVLSSARVPKELLPLMSHVEAHQENLWRALHDDNVDYLCDRHVSVSAPVYDELHNRQPLVEPSWWYDKVHVLYPVLPLPVLYERMNSRGDETVSAYHLNKLLQLYEDVLQKFPMVSRFNGELPREQLAMQVRECVLTSCKKVR